MKYVNKASLKHIRIEIASFFYFIIIFERQYK